MHDINFHSYVQLASLVQGPLESAQGRLTVVSSILGQVTQTSCQNKWDE